MYTSAQLVGEPTSNVVTRAVASNCLISAGHNRVKTSIFSLIFADGRISRAKYNSICVPFSKIGMTCDLYN